MDIPIIAINKFIFWVENAPLYELVPKIWKDNNLATHLNGKFEKYLTEYGRYGGIFAFYADLDIENRRIFLSYILDNYHGEQRI